MISASGSGGLVPRRVFLAATPALLIRAAPVHAGDEHEVIEPPRALRGIEMLPPGVRLPAIRLQDAEGGEVTTDTIIGRPFVLNLWATWCAPCVEELPSLKRLSEKANHDFQVVLVSQDRGGAAVAQTFLRRLSVDVPSFADPQARLSRMLSARGLPTTFLGRADGALLGRYEGAARWDRPEVVTFLAGILRRG